MFRKTGYKFEYHIELHKCLKQLVIKVINQKDYKLQLLYLKEVYRWFHEKLVTMGLLSKRDQEKEQALLNPMARSMSASMTKMIKHKVLSHLVNEDETRENHKKMFYVEGMDEDEDPDGFFMRPERSLHTSIPPANVRIQNFTRKSLKDYEKIVSEVQAKDKELYQQKMSISQDQQRGLMLAKMGSIYDLPQTSRADNRTQAETSFGGSQYNPATFEKTERAVRKKPFDTFYTTNITAENPNP